MIYFDNSATTQVDPSVLETYQIVTKQFWGNPSSLHKLGETAFDLLEQSRMQIAELLNVKAGEIYFTSSGTEGDNWAIKGTAFEKQQYGKHLIASSIEHPAVLNSLKQLEKLGFEVTYLPVDETGQVSVADLQNALRPDTILVSVMAVNNEMGRVQPITAIADLLAHYPKVHFHVDAVQAVGKDLMGMLHNHRIDMITFSGHKFHAPRGTGFMYIKQGRKLAPLLNGGGQEQNQRSSTENLAGIAAMAKAFRLVMQDEHQKAQKQAEIKAFIYNHLAKQEKVKLFSHLGEGYAPHILCFTIEGVRGETIVHAFEEQGIFLSTTSACSSKKQVAGGTLTAMGVPEKTATSAVRISLDEKNTMAEAEQFINVFDDLYEKFKKINS